VAVVQQTVEDRGRDDVIGEHRTPFAARLLVISMLPPS
jgi:hypothetical protein